MLQQQPLDFDRSHRSSMATFRPFDIAVWYRAVFHQSRHINSGNIAACSSRITCVGWVMREMIQTRQIKIAHPACDRIITIEQFLKIPWGSFCSNRARSVLPSTAEHLSRAEIDHITRNPRHHAQLEHHPSLAIFHHMYVLRTRVDDAL